MLGRGRGMKCGIALICKGRNDEVNGIWIIYNKRDAHSEMKEN